MNYIWKHHLPGSSSRDLVKGPIFVTISGLKNVTSKAEFPWRIEGMAPQLYRVKRFEIETCLLKPKYEPRKKTLLLFILSYSVKGPWNKSLNFYISY